MQTLRRGPRCQLFHPQSFPTSWMQLIASGWAYQTHRLRINSLRSKKISWSHLQQKECRGPPKPRTFTRNLWTSLMHDPASGIQHLFQSWKGIQRCLQGRQILLQNQLWGTRLPTQEPWWALTGFRGDSHRWGGTKETIPSQGSSSHQAYSASPQGVHSDSTFSSPGVQIW